MISNAYERYAEANLLSASPLQLVVILYECACENVNAACAFSRAGDHAGRGRAINRTLDVLLELIASCDDTAEMSKRLLSLYAYIQSRLIEAHLEQSEEKLHEVAGLLRTMLDGWRQIATAANDQQRYTPEPELPAAVVAMSEAAALSSAYGRF